MIQQTLRVSAGLLAVVFLSLGIGGPEARAQLRASARSPQIDAPQSPSRLNPYRPLKNYVRQSDAPAVRPPLRPSVSPNSPRLSRGQKLLWGSVGLLVNVLCESRRDPYDTRCEDCDRVGNRAVRGLLKGMFSGEP
jgi:hypothetical protein